jgi:hypothetical protein
MDIRMLGWVLATGIIAAGIEAQAATKVKANNTDALFRIAGERLTCGCRVPIGSAASRDGVSRQPDFYCSQ